MGNKKNWFDRLKRFCGSATKSKQEKKEKRKRWAFGTLKSKCLPVLPASSLEAAEHEQSMHAVAVAVITAVAAEAAVAAAQAAAEVVRLTETSYCCSEEIAAIKIQTAFRGYLARSALKALKGLVKLQALIRGCAVRRQASNTFKCLQSLMIIQSQARVNRVRALVECQAHEWKDISHRKPKNSKVPKAEVQKKGRKWENSILSQEEMIALLKNRREAAMKRERAMEYAASYQDRRRPTTPVSGKFESNAGDRRWSWPDDWVGLRPLDRDIPEIFSTPCRGHTKERADEPQLRCLARRSFNRSRRTSIRDNDSFSSSPCFPSYMTPTASAKERFRSLSTPKQRVRTADSCSEYCCTPNMDRLLSPVPSVSSDVGFSKGSKTQSSPQFKSQTWLTNCRRPSDYLSFDPDCSLLNWDPRIAIRYTS